MINYAVEYNGVLEAPWLVPIPIRTDTLWRKIKAVFTSRRFCLGKDFYYYASDGTLCVIPAAFNFYLVDGQVKFELKEHYFTSDGKSYPRVFRSLLSPVGIGLIEGLVHDFGYRYRCQITAEGEIINRNYTRKQWDAELYCIGMGVNNIVTSSTTSYCILRVFGWGAWRSHRTRDYTASNNPNLLMKKGITTHMVRLAIC